MADKRGLRIYQQNLPDDVREIIVKTQADVKAECKCIYSQEQVIYKLIRMGDKSNTK
jgi:hypothetical protein